MHDSYLKVVDMPREMRGEGAPRQMVFGVLGHTKESSKMKSLGGLVHERPSAKVRKGTVEHHSQHVRTERHITGPAAKTHIPGAHFGMVPYAGQFMAHVGREM